MTKFRCLFLAVPVVSAALCGCREETTAPLEQRSDHAERREVGERLLAGALDMLNRSDEFDEGSTDVAVAQMVRRLNESLDLSSSAPTSDPLTLEDGKVLREITWLRDAARHAVGGETDPVRRAEKLFDWLVRNFQITPDDAPADVAPPLLPWHALLLGRGTALEQAWLFQLLARQQDLDVVLLAQADGSTDAAPRWWCAALAFDGEAYLFDPRIGLPIVGPDGRRPATLRQVAADDRLLRALDLPNVAAYPMTAAAAAKLVAWCETSSIYQAPRLARLEEQLVGHDRMTLSIDAAGLLERAGKCVPSAEARPWPMRDLRFAATRERAVNDRLRALIRPFRIPEREMLPDGRYIAPPLWKARVRHLSGKFDDPVSGRPTLGRWYQEARPADEDLEKLKLNPQTWEGLMRMKQHATYWLGLAAYEQRRYEAGIRFLELPLKDRANGGWTVGARYNLGRCYEALQRPAEAVAAYRSSPLGVPPDPRAEYRARRVESAAASAPGAPPAAATASPTAAATSKPAAKASATNPR